jgi:hypothetical protein
VAAKLPGDLSHQDGIAIKVIPSDLDTSIFRLSRYV